MLAVQLSLGQTLSDTFQKSRRSASEGTFLAKGGPLAAVEGGWVDMVLVWDTAVHGLAGHLLVPLSIHASHGDAGLHLEKDTCLQPPQPEGFDQKHFKTNDSHYFGSQVKQSWA